MRILKNKTAETCAVTCSSKTVEIPANDQADLSEQFSQVELGSSESLLLLLAQGVDKYQLNDGSKDLSVTEAVDLVRGYSQKTPQAADGKLYVSPDMWPLGTLTNFTGAADDVANGVEGADFLGLESTQVEDKTKTLQFIVPSYLAGGHIQYKGGVLGDHISFKTLVPGTVGTDVGAGQGSYAKAPIGGGINVFVPYPGGGWDLNLTEKENANVAFTKVRPVPAPGSDGFFDWNPATGVVTVNAVQKGGFNLLDADIVINELVTKVGVIGDDHFPLTVPAVRPVRLLPQWKFVVTLHNSTAKTLQLAAMLYRGKGNIL